MRWPSSSVNTSSPPPAMAAGQRSRTASGRLRSATLSMRKMTRPSTTAANSLYNVEGAYAAAMAKPMVVSRKDSVSSS